ncbi:MAG: SpoIID/LytB domain-containing protein [Phycisphaerales bacterium]|nr:SpoIID/LytB domain-containing protein [Phycisphaerales bacterium]
MPTTDSAAPQTQAQVSSHLSEGIAIPVTEPIVRVRLHRVGAGQPITIGEAGQSLTIRGGGAKIQIVGTVTLWREGGHWASRQGTPLSSAIINTPIIDVSAIDPMQVSGKSGRRYPTTIRCVADGDLFDVINVTPMSEYIPGVLAGELFEGWHDAAFEAQAVAARSFAVSECAQRQSRHWDVTDTPASQHYIGVPTWSQAQSTAAATAGQVLTFDGQIVAGYFSSCCGGRAATALDAVGPNPINSLAPLGGHGNPAACTHAPRYTWSDSWDAKDVARALQKFGARVGRSDLKRLRRVTAIRPIKPNQHGRPTMLDVGGAEVRCVDLPGIFTESGLKAPPSGWVSGRVRSGTLHLEGHGFGHGVGLCQYGAEDLASKSSAAHDILQFYYPGASITKAW